MWTVFCLFADDAGFFEPCDILLGFIKEHAVLWLRPRPVALMHLFRVLDTPPNRRQAELDEDLAVVPVRERRPVRRSSSRSGLRYRDAHCSTRDRLTGR